MEEKRDRGRPRKENVQFNTTLSPELSDLIEAIALTRGWPKNYTVEQSLRAVFGMKGQYSARKIRAIAKGEA